MNGHLTVAIAVSDGTRERSDAERVSIAGIHGEFCVHPRRVEAQQVATINMNWVVTHIASGRVVAYGYTRDGAIREAEQTIKRLGRRKFRRLTLRPALAMQRKVRAGRQA